MMATRKNNRGSSRSGHGGVVADMGLLGLPGLPDRDRDLGAV